MVKSAPATSRLKPDQLKASIEAHNASFDELLRHIPAKYYIRPESDDEDETPKQSGKLTKAQRKALKKAKQDETVRAAKNEAKREARLARYDPDEPKTIAEIQASKLSGVAKGKKRAADSGNEADASFDGELNGDAWEDEEDSPNETDFADSDDEDGEMLELNDQGLLQEDGAKKSGGPAPTITELREKLQRRIADIQAKKRGEKAAASGKKHADASDDEEGEDEDEDEDEEGSEAEVKSKDDLLAERRRRAALRDNRRKKLKERLKAEKSDGSKKRANEPSNGRKGGGKANAVQDDERPRKKAKAEDASGGDVHSLVPYDSAAASTSTTKADPNSIAFSTLDFSSSSQHAADAGLTPKQLKKMQAAEGSLKKNRHALPKDANQALEIIQKRKERLDALDPEKREKKEEKERWEKVMLKAEGEKVRDDEKRLKKTAKRQEREKRKSAKAWTDRKATVEKTISDKVAKRNANLAARSKAVKDKKMGIKNKKSGNAKKVSTSSGKARSKGRPGFEGGGRKKK
ncbi:ribosomal RNA-processing protein 14, RRP14 [Rhodotorula toruloides]|uniref:Ribosomal RNA-processing protein 14, RRP14 n=1 Tax=Rhodotorula toruloides TaxID=5286 RepID=A0A511KK72_RHOTO|nr:ribosomal RNA-processing protein 14, RRP14 [Rhodotorula toruloides]